MINAPDDETYCMLSFNTIGIYGVDFEMYGSFGATCLSKVIVSKGVLDTTSPFL